MNTTSANFVIEKEINWEVAGEGITRQIMGYDDHLMIVKVKFEQGAIGYLHEHIHSQSTYVASGIFEVTINGTKQTLSTGDGFYAEPSSPHGVICLEAGILIDAFSPVRKDFLGK